MQRNLKAYNIVLETIGPVFVGSGREISKKEYVFLDREHVGILDQVKLYQFMKQRHLQKDFENYLVNDFRQDVGQWLRQYRIDLEEIFPCVKYTLKCGDTSLQRGTKTTVVEHIKDGCGLPYIPGSTIKGMLRTILLADDIISNPDAYANDKRNLENALFRYKGKVNRNSYLKKEAGQIEIEAFRTLHREKTKPSDAVNDELSGMIVGDSTPIELDRMILCQKFETHVDGTVKSLNLLGECIQPGTAISFLLTLDEQRCRFSIEDIQHAISKFNDAYNKYFLTAFRTADLIQADAVFLGGGTGFLTKTIVYPLFEKREGLRATQSIFENTKVPRAHQHYRDAEMGVSPHILKCTKYEGQLLQMGQCKLLSATQIS